jgi:hypothetical protein
MKFWMRFAYHDYYPSGGVGDFVGASLTREGLPTPPSMYPNVDDELFDTEIMDFVEEESVKK